MPETSPKRHSKKLWFNFLIENWPWYTAGIFMVILTDSMQVLVTRTLGWILDYFNQSTTPNFLLSLPKEQTFMALFGILLGSRVLLFLARMGWRFTLARQTHKASSYLKEKIWDDVRFFKDRDLQTRFTKGILMNATTSDVNSGRFMFGFTLVAMVDVVFLGIFTMLTMFTIHVPLTLWSLGILLILPIFIRKLSGSEMEKYKKAQEFLGTFNDLASQVVSTIRLQRLTQTGSFWEKRLLGNAWDYRNKRLDAVNTSLLYIPLMGGASVVCYLVLFGLGINYTLSGSLSIGDFVAMQGLIFLLQDPLFELGFIISEWKKSFTSLERLSEIFTHSKDESLLLKGMEIEPVDVVFDARNLTFSYPDGDSEVLKDLNLTLKQGERLGISGAIGAGKSSLVNILAGLEREHKGDVKFYGKDFNSYSHEILRDHIGYVSQKPFLFADTIRENIRLDKELNDQEIWEYLELAGLKKDVENFPDQLDTPLGEWGINLSGGQKQRLTLARALARKPEVLFLDDCLSAVDTVTEERILKNLDEKLKETTLIWVAHRKSTLKYCSQYLEM